MLQLTTRTMEMPNQASKKKKATISLIATHVETPKQVRRHITVMRSSRFVMDSLMQLSSHGAEGRVELDTHTDTCVAGSNTVDFDLTGKNVAVSPFCKTEYEASQDIPIATMATNYDCPTSGRTFIQIVHEEDLYFGDKMTHNTLLCLNHLHHNGLRVEDCSRQYNDTSLHSITAPGSDHTIPLSMRGVISGFVITRPTEDKIDDANLHVQLKSEIDWDPYATEFERGSYLVLRPSRAIRTDPAWALRTCLSEANNLAERLVISTRCVAYMDLDVGGTLRDLQAVVRGDVSSEITPEHVAKRWQIGF